MCSRWLPERGTTLAETLVAGVILVLLLGVTVGLVRDYAAVYRRQSRHDDLLQVVQALQQIRGEVEGAVEILEPLPGSTGPGSTLVLRRLDVYAAGRIPPVLIPSPSPLPASWEPQDAAYLVDVTYSLSQGNLTRQAGGEPEMLLARNLAGFTAENTAAGSVLVRATALAGRLHSYRVLAVRP